MPDKERTVWVCHKKKEHTFKKAEKFGKVKILMENTVNVFRDKKLTESIYRKLKDSSPDDLILLSGDRVPVAMAVAVFLQIHGQVNILFHNPKKYRYEIRKDFARIPT